MSIEKAPMTGMEGARLQNATECEVSPHARTLLQNLRTSFLMRPLSGWLNACGPAIPRAGRTGSVEKSWRLLHKMQVCAN